MPSHHNNAAGYTASFKRAVDDGYNQKLVSLGNNLKNVMSQFEKHPLLTT